MIRQLAAAAEEICSFTSFLVFTMAIYNICYNSCLIFHLCLIESSTEYQEIIAGRTVSVISASLSPSGI